MDIDTDSDLIGNEMDTDDDGDEYPDDVESPYDYDPLDNTDKPTPIVDLGDDQEVNEGEDASFDAGESYSPVSLDLISYVWDFGDGTILNSNDYTEESEYITPTHTYDSDGDYDVVLTIADMYGSDSALITVTVNDLGPTATIEGPTTGETSTPLDYTAQVDSIDTCQIRMGLGR